MAFNPNQDGINYDDPESPQRPNKPALPSPGPGYVQQPDGSWIYSGYNPATGSVTVDPSNPPIPMTPGKAPTAASSWNVGGGWGNASGASKALQDAFNQGLTGQAAVDYVNSHGYNGAIAYYSDRNQYGIAPDGSSQWGSYVAPNAQNNGALDLIQRAGPENGSPSTGQIAPTTDPALQGILDLLTKQQSDTEAQKSADQAKADALYSQLQGIAGQSLALDPNDPVIKGQADAYDAAQQRSRRNYLSQLAESSGPNANLAGAQRTTAESLGQNDAAFTAQLMGNELTARRQQVSDALNGMRGLLTPEQQNDLQAELNQMNTAIGAQQSQAQLAQQGSEFNASQSQALMLALQQLGLTNTYNTNYWNAIAQGLI